MEKKFAVNAYRMFLIWGIFSALGTAVSTLVDAVLIGNYIGSDGLAVTNIATPVFLLFALLSVTTAVGANVLIGQALGKSETEEANKLFHIQLTAGLVETVVCMVTGILGGRKLICNWSYRYDHKSGRVLYFYSFLMRRCIYFLLYSFLFSAQ